RELVAFEPGTFAGDDCAGVVELLARVDKACAAARLRAAARAAACGAPVARGFVRASDWLAQHTGTSISEAQRTLQIAAKLEALPATRDAVVAGELSVDQAHEIVATVEACPDAERAMLAAARAGNLWSLRDEGRRRRLSAVDVETLHRRQHAARFHQHWRDGDGMIRDTGALAPEAGIAVMNRLDGETDRAWRAAQRSGRHESRERYAADAFARVVTGGGSGRPGRADVVFVHDVGTGTSTVIGGGPVPAPTVRVALEDAFVKAVLHDGTKVDTVAHYGRHFPAILRTASRSGIRPRSRGRRASTAAASSASSGTTSTRSRTAGSRRWATCARAARCATTRRPSAIERRGCWRAHVRRRHRDRAPRSACPAVGVFRYGRRRPTQAGGPTSLRVRGRTRRNGPDRAVPARCGRSRRA